MTLSVYETCVFVCYFLRLFVEFSERMLDWTHAKAQHEGGRHRSHELGA